MDFIDDFSCMHSNSPSQKAIFTLDGIDDLLGILPQRTQNILRARYNLDGTFSRGKTLEAIGKQYGITRERVRQVIQFALKSAREKGMDRVAGAVEALEASLVERGGIFAKDPLFRHLGVRDLDEAGATDFLLDVSDRFCVHHPDRYVEHAVSQVTFSLADYVAIIERIESMLTEAGSPLTLSDIARRLAEEDSSLEEGHLEAYLVSSAPIGSNPLGEWGLTKWSSIRPKSSGERAHLVLRHYKRPMHFTEIAEKINELGLSKRRSNPQTVHNELIKSPLFVLTGRGTYSLTEWQR